MSSESPVSIFVKRYDEYITSINGTIDEKEGKMQTHKDARANTSNLFNPANQKDLQRQRGREARALKEEKQKAEEYCGRLQTIEEEVEKLRGDVDRRSDLQSLLREKNTELNSKVQQLEHFKSKFLA